MDRLDAMRVFVMVADLRGFAAAARALRMSPPAVTRAVVALERRIGARLLERTTRSVRLTEAGERFHADCKRLLAELEEAEASAGGAHAEPRGLLCVTAPTMFGRLHVTPVLMDFLALHPKLTARTFFVDRIVHLVDEGYDVAVRIARLPDSSLTAIPVGQVRVVVVASPAYLAAHGEPVHPRDLDGLPAVGFSQLGGAPAPWEFGLPGGDKYAAQPQIPLVVNLPDVSVAAAVAGRGVVRVMSYQVAEHVRAGRLRVLLRDYEPPARPVHLVYPAGRHAPAKVRAFVDYAAQRLRAELAQLDP